MTCPSCRLVLDKADPSCPKCGFTMDVALKKFPFPAPKLEAVIDPSQTLTKEEAHSIRAQVGKLQKRLPQLQVFNCIVSLGSEIDLREFGFWLLNEGQIEGMAGKKDFALLFLVDPKGQALSVTVGYGLEPIIMDSEWETLCNRCRDLFYRDKLAEGIGSFLTQAGDLLASVAIKMRKERRKK